MGELTKRIQQCLDCEELLSNFEGNFFRMRERRCFYCMIYLESERPCDKCGAPAKWFYIDPRPGMCGLCDSCAPDEQKSTFE